MNNERIAHFYFCAQNYHERKITCMWPKFKAIRFMAVSGDLE